MPQLKSLGMYFFSSMTPPGEPEEQHLKKMEGRVSDYATAVLQFIEKDYVDFAQELEKAGLMALKLEVPVSKS